MRPTLGLWRPRHRSPKTNNDVIAVATSPLFVGGRHPEKTPKP